MLKIALGQIEVVPGRPDLNTAAMLTMIEEARVQKAALIVFPEMAVPGYLLGDTWEQAAFLRDCEAFGRSIIDASGDIAVMFGNIAVDWERHNDDGRVRKYNAFFTAYRGELVAPPGSPYPFQIKTLQPNDRSFDDDRHFYSLRRLAEDLRRPPAELLRPVEINFPDRPLRVGRLICEDGWPENDPADPIAAMQRHHSADLIVDISNSPFTLGKNQKRNRLFSRQARAAGAPIVYVNATGLQNNGKTVYTFDGVSAVYDKDGAIRAQGPAFAAALQFVDLDLTAEGCPADAAPPDDDAGALYAALSYGVDRFLKSISLHKVVIGISGGIDSSVTAALYTKVLGPENVLLVNMPSIYNSATTKGLAARLARNLGCFYAVLPIQDSVDYTIRQLTEASIVHLTDQSALKLSVSQLAAENIQARDRSSRILAGLAAAFGGGFTCNANKSETTVGYATLYGDQAGFLAALGDLWKFQVYDLARYLNETVYQREVIPEATLTIVPSAELSPQHAVDEGKGDPLHYPYHDYLFRAFMERWDRMTPEDILAWYKDGALETNLGCQAGLVARLFPSAAAFIEDLERWWKLYTGMGVAKRIQAPPILAVSRRAYGFDQREAQNPVYFTAAYHALKNELLVNHSH